VLVLELGDRAGGRGHPRGGDGLQERVHDGFLQSTAAKGLAAGVGVVQHVTAHARIPADLPAGPGIRDLHPSAAATTPDQPLQQRGALAGGTAAFAARSHVLTQPLAGGEVFSPGDIAGMVLGEADRPLLQHHLNVADPNLPVTVD
jgi:hypothetical protein